MNKENKEKEECCAKNGRGAFGAVFLVAVGLVLLLNNFNLLPWGIWESLWRFWPILLVIWGLQIMLGKTLLGNFLISIIGFFLIGFVFVYSASLVNSNFDGWMSETFPCWSQIKKVMPQERFKLGNKVFKCNPLDGSCQLYYR